MSLALRGRASQLAGQRALLVAGLAVLVFGVATALSGAAPNYSDWSAPVNLGPTVNSTASDNGPALSKDGLSLYFTSNRAAGFGGEDIWVSQRDSVDADWGTPVNLGATINTAAGESVPALSRDGHWMFFASDRAGGSGGTNIWASWRPQTHDDFGWQAPVNVGPNVNSGPAGAAGPSYFENDGGAPQLFFVSSRPGGLGSGDLYMSELQADGSWGPATALTELNSSANDARPTIRHDGLEIFFFSGRAGGRGGNDLWVATRDTVDAPWSTPDNVGAPVNTSADENRPGLSPDGETLMFSSNRSGGFGSTDLYMSTRTKEQGHGGDK
jgi:Tol biopolymer transport system component